MGTTRQRVADLFSRERRRLLAWLRMRLTRLDALEPEDLLSEVFHQLLDRADLVAEVENLGAYAQRALANRLLDHRRRQDRHGMAREEEEPAAWTASAAPAAGRPDRQLESADFHADLERALDQLRPEERVVWVAHEVEGIPFRELSERWQIPINTLLSRKHRATARLRRLLEAHQTDKGGRNGS